MINNLTAIFGKTKRVLKSLREEAARNRAEGTRLLALEKKIMSGPENEKEGVRNVIDISTSSVAKSTLAILGIVALGWFVLEIKNIISLFFIAAFLALAIDPFVDRMQSWKIPRGIGAMIIYIVFFGTAGIVISSFVPILAGEIPKLASSVLDWVEGFGVETTAIQAQITELQNYLSDIQSNLNQENITAGLNVLSTIGQNAFAVVKSIAGGVVSFIMILVIAFFMIIDEDGIKSFLIALFPQRFHKYILEKGAAVENKFGAWVRGQAILMVLMGVLTFATLWTVELIINSGNPTPVNLYPATLGTLAALTELLPYVGPVIAFVPAVILALSQGGWFLAFVITMVYVAIQQLEGNVLVPLVMKKVVGLSPVIIMFAMFVGASFPETVNPIVGIIISVPIATAVSVFVRDYTTKQK